MKRHYQRTVLLIGGVFAVIGLVRLSARSGDSLDDVRATERQIRLANGAAPSGFIDCVALSAMVFRKERDTTKLWQKWERQMQAHVELGEMLRFVVPLDISSASSTNWQNLHSQLFGAAQARFPEGCWTYEPRSNSFLITARPQSSNEWVRLITELQTAR